MNKGENKGSVDDDNDDDDYNVVLIINANTKGERQKGRVE